MGRCKSVGSSKLFLRYRGFQHPDFPTGYTVIGGWLLASGHHSLSVETVDNTLLFCRKEVKILLFGSDGECMNHSSENKCYTIWFDWSVGYLRDKLGLDVRFLSISTLLLEFDGKILNSHEMISVALYFIYYSKGVFKNYLEI